MARYSRSSYSRRRAEARRRIYTVLVVLIIGGTVLLVYRHFNKKEEPINASQPDITTPVETNVTEQEPDISVVVSEPPPEPNSLKIPSAPVAEPNSRTAGIIAEALACLSDRPAGIIEARNLLNDVLNEPMNSQQQMFVKERLSELSKKWLFSRTYYPQDGLCGSYKVKRGDRLIELGKRYRVPHEILMEINKIPRAEALREGETIKVINGPFHAKIYLSAFTMDLYLQNTFVRSYSIGIGQEDKETPTGLWRVRADGRMIEPPWYDYVTKKVLHAGEPGYALGSRWIGLEGLEGAAKGRTGFGIHGTHEPKSIGKASSRGCIRLHNGNVIEVYNVLMPIHSLVRVVE